MEVQCRACLSKDELFDWNTVIAENISYADMFFHITKLKPNDFEEMQNLCCSCGLEIRNVYDFIKKATESERNLRCEIYSRHMERFTSCTDKPSSIESDEVPSKVEIDVIQEADLEEFVEEDVEEGQQVEAGEDVDSVDLEFELVDIGSVKSETEEYLYDDANEAEKIPNESEANKQGEAPSDQEFESERDLTKQNEIIKRTTKEQNSPTRNGIKTNTRVMRSKRRISDSEFEAKENTCRTTTGAKRRKDKKSFKICEYCAKEFRSISSKNRHVAVIHEHGERLLCDACPRTFRDVFTLAKHKKTHDVNRERQYACQFCDLKFLTSTSLKQHLDTHNENREKRFQCDQCEKAFFQRGALNVHRRLHTGQMVQCEYCDKKYPRQVDLDIHKRTHTGETPFKCGACEKSFTYRSSLYNHMRKEHFGFIYKCTYCSKQFTDDESRKAHMKEHKDYPYKCALCDRESAKKFSIKRHIRELHGIEDSNDIDQHVISCRSETRYRKMRNFTNVEYDSLIAE